MAVIAGLRKRFLHIIHEKFSYKILAIFAFLYLIFIYFIKGYST